MQSIYDVSIQCIFFVRLGERFSLHHYSSALIHSMTIFMKAYCVPYLSWEPRGKEIKGSISGTQMPKVICPGIRDKNELRAN